jgi:hypothetical protein
MQDVKIQCTDVARGLVEELQQCFPSQKIMNAIGIINP